MKKINTHKLAIAKRMPMVTERWGTKVGSVVRRMVRRTSRQYKKVAMNVPRTNWVAVSRMKLRRSRGPNCEDASERATKVSEKTTPAMVIIDPAMVCKTALAPSAPPV